MLPTQKSLIGSFEKHGAFRNSHRVCIPSRRSHYLQMTCIIMLMLIPVLTRLVQNRARASITSHKFQGCRRRTTWKVAYVAEHWCIIKRINMANQQRERVSSNDTHRDEKEDLRFFFFAAVFCNFARFFRCCLKQLVCTILALKIGKYLVSKLFYANRFIK